MTVALITGGSKGIGLDLVRRLSKEGIQVITCSRSEQGWLEAVDAYPELSKVEHVVVDIADSDQIDGMFDWIRSRWTKLDLAVNNASPAIASLGAFKEVDIELLTETLNVDFVAQARCLQHELNMMQAGGAIVNLSSVNGFRPTPNAAMYSAAKHAIEGLTRTVALESAKDGIRVNAVAPGVTWTPRWQKRTQANPDLKNKVASQVPLGRFAISEEISDAIAFLLSDKARYITGHTLVVDGGLSLA